MFSRHINKRGVANVAPRLYIYNEADIVDIKGMYDLRNAPYELPGQKGMGLQSYPACCWYYYKQTTGKFSVKHINMHIGPVIPLRSRTES